ncbi:MAG: acylphosphatase [Candidatus Aminicenantes bacterium 4484_214]|nr:MAG: acylphosphatase [Candidatus Aminicenantes bacterium 4484_214]HDJ23964.1 acylphosphatase [Candidatus Aminicenantes bacterium]
MVRAHVYVSGRVQGVFFRDHTRRWADSLGVKGWVRNLPDGRVEAVLEGPKNEVEALLQRMEEGPPYAKVTKMDVDWEEYQGEFTDFRIRW